MTLSIITECHRLLVETSFCMLISSYYDQFVVLFKTNNLYAHIDQLLAILCIHYDMQVS